jgi:hypothetical protein
VGRPPQRRFQCRPGHGAHRHSGSLAIYLLGGARPEAPRLDLFRAQEAPAWHSPPLLAAVRNLTPELGLEKACLESD